MAKKSNKKNLVLIVLIIALLGLAVGYAAFSDVLTISGTANVASNVTFDVFFDATSAVASYQGCTASVQREADGNGDANDKLTVTVANLQYPGAGAQIKAVVKNNSSVPVKITGLSSPTNITGNSSAIKITGLNNIATDTASQTIAAGGSCEIYFTVEWDPEFTDLNSLDTTDTAGFSFSVGINFEQSSDVLNVTPKNAINFVAGS